MAVLPAHYIQELVARNDIADVISNRVSLKRNGRIYKGLCPFHSEKTPSFTVYPETQSYYCFGCGAGGDVVTYIKETENLSYTEAVKYLAQKSGMPLFDEDDTLSKQKSRIYQMNKITAKFFYENLNKKQGEIVRSYLRKRGLTDKTITNFGIGYSLDEWSSLLKLLRSKGFSQEEISLAYLGVKSKNADNYYDVFRNRVMFPIIDIRGNVIAFGARALGDDMPKYLNSGDTPVFKKSSNLFALNIARKSSKDFLILAEGYMDVIALHQAGYDNAVATLGTALTIGQVKLISTYTKKVVIAYDSDEAGQKATQKALSLFSQEEMEVQVLELKGAKDPDEYIKRFGKESFDALLQGANTAIDFELLKIRSKYDIKKADELVRYLTDAAEVLAKLKNPIEQDVYAARLSNETNTDKDSIKKQIANTRSKNYNKQKYIQRQNILKQGALQGIKVDYTQKSNTLPKVFLQQQLIYSLLKNNSFYKTIKDQIPPERFTDNALRDMYKTILQIIENEEKVEFVDMFHIISDDDKKILSQIIANNPDTIIEITDVQHYINRLLSEKLTQEEIKDMSNEDLASRLRDLKEKKK